MLELSGTTAEGTQRKRTLILSAVLILLLAGVGWSLVRSRQPAVKPKVRTPFDILVTWRCLACGHELIDKAGVGPRECPQCAESEMYVSIRHQCRRHGPRLVAFQYSADGRPTRVKAEQGPWVPYARPLADQEADDEESLYNVRCPVCGEVMDPVP